MRALPLAAALVLAAPLHASAQEYYADVRPLLVQNCMRCHTESGIGWSMEDAEATFAKRARIARAVTRHVMPPWLAEEGHQEYLGDLALDEDLVQMVARWRAAGFPKGDPRPDPPRSTEVVFPFATDVSLDILPGRSYLPNQSRDDDYRCFLTDWPETERRYVTGFRAVPGNDKVAHHVVVHVVTPEMLDRFKEIDAETDGPGYECFGGALPSDFDWDAYETRYPDGIKELSRSEWWLTHWAPGMFGYEFPQGTGIPIEPGSGLVVQMHYYSKKAPGERDQGTKVEFDLASEVERPAFMLVQTRNDWLEGEKNGSMVIPAGENATYVLQNRLSDFLDYAAWITGMDADRVGGFTINSANLHMHAFGASGDVSLTDPNGRTQTLLAIPRWDLRWQRDFAFTQPKVFPRDQLEDTWLRVRCTYENDSDDTVYGGYGSFDEMCFNMSYVTIQPEVAATGGEDTGPGQRAPGGAR